LKHKHRWQHWEEWPHPPSWEEDGHPFPSWPTQSRHKRRFLLWRFVGAFGAIVLLLVGGMAALAFVLAYLFKSGQQVVALVWVGSCGMVLAFPILAVVLAARSFRSIATPLADVMAAADALAEGDLSVRVPVRGRDSFAQLTRSFNRMAEELERADQQRRNLTADVAHELRTPLHIIQGNLEGILDGVYGSDEEHITAMLEETRSLARLVEDLQTLSLAEAGQLPLTLESVDVAELLADVRTSFSGQADVAGIDLQVELADPDAPLVINADAGRMSQVLGNLLANALRYTPAGGSITLRVEPFEEGVRIIVRDTGAGIPAEDLPFVFDRFWRGDRSRSHTGGAGSGLGLAIARQLVHAHGGHISVQSELGQGTTFTIELRTEGM